MKPNPIEVISEGIIGDILNGTTPVGKPLHPERKLSESFGHSRTSIREALYQLEKKGYVKLLSNRRPIALIPTTKSIIASTINQMKNLDTEFEAKAYLEQLRQFIEVGALRSVIKKSGSIEFVKIHNSLINNYESIGNLNEFIRSDILFHKSIVAVVDNLILISLHEE